MLNREERRVYAFCHLHIFSLGPRTQIGPGEVNLQLAFVPLCHFILEDERRENQIGQAIV